MNRNQIEAAILNRMHDDCMCGFKNDANPLDMKADIWFFELRSMHQRRKIAGMAIQSIALFIMAYAIIAFIIDGISVPHGLYHAGTNLWVGLTALIGLLFWPIED